jgi:cytochrome c-type biogenesis protein CcmF
MVELTHSNTRRYGGYMVHMGIVLMFVGFTGAAFNQDSTEEVKVGDRFPIGRYEISVTDLREGDNENFSWNQAQVAVFQDGKQIATLDPARRFYKASNQPSAIVSIRRRLNEDLYLNFAGMSSDNQKAVMQAYVFPLVSWIWIGFWVVMVGTLVCLVPSKQRLDYPRTQVVGVKGSYAPVEK